MTEYLSPFRSYTVECSECGAAITVGAGDDTDMCDPCWDAWRPPTDTV